MANPLPLYLNVDGVYRAEHLAQPWGDVIAEGVLLTGAPAGLDPLKVAPLTPAGMGVEVAAGAAWIKNDGSDADSAYFEAGAWRLSRPESLQVPIEASEAQPRIDRVILEVLDTQFGAASDTGRVRVVKGTAAASPAAPAEPSSSITLALVTVPASAGTIVAGNIADQRPAAAAGGRVAGGMAKIGDVSLSAPAATLDFPNIPQTFTHLRLVTYLRIDASVATGAAFARFNGTATSYHNERTQANAATVAAIESLDDPGIRLTVPGANATAGNFAAGASDIPNYRGSARAVAISQHGWQTTGPGSSLFVSNSFGTWHSNAAINRVTLMLNAGNFIAGSRATLYGLA